MSTRPSTLFSFFTLFLLLSLISTHKVYAKPRPDLSTPSFNSPTPSSSPSSPASGPTGPTSPSSSPNNGGGATSSPDQPVKSKPSPSSHSPSPTQNNNPQPDPSSQTSIPTSSSSSSDPIPSSSSPSSSSQPSFSPSSSVSHNTAAVDQTRTGLVVPPTTPAATPVNAPSQNDPLTTDDSTPTDAAAGKPVSFLQNKGAVAGTFTVVGLVVAALIIFLASYFLRKRRERDAFNGDYDEFDTSTQNWTGPKRFMGNRRDTYARSSFGMAAMAEKSSNHGHDYAANETLQDDLGTDVGHQEMRTTPFDPYQNNYALPSHNFGAPFDNSTQYHQGYDNSHLSPPVQHQQSYTIPHHIPPISTFGQGSGPLIATATADGSAPYQSDAYTQQTVSPDSVYTPTPIASHYAQNPYHLDSYYGGSTSLNPAPSEHPQPQQHQQYHEQGYHASARDPSTRSGPTEWGVAC